MIARTGDIKRVLPEGRGRPRTVICLELLHDIVACRLKLPHAVTIEKINKTLLSTLHQQVRRPGSLVRQQRHAAGANISVVLIERCVIIRSDQCWLRLRYVILRPEAEYRDLWRKSSQPKHCHPESHPPTKSRRDFASRC